MDLKFVISFSDSFDIFGTLYFDFECFVLTFLIKIFINELNTLTYCNLINHLIEMYFNFSNLFLYLYMTLNLLELTL